MRLWAGRGLADAAGVITQPNGSAVCGVSFCSEDDNAIALASADCHAYVYDLRRMESPLQVQHHLLLAATSIWRVQGKIHVDSN